MSHGYIVNIKLCLLIVLAQTELLVNLDVFNLLELAGTADTAEYKCGRKYSGVTFTQGGAQVAVVFACLLDDFSRYKIREMTINILILCPCMLSTGLPVVLASYTICKTVGIIYY